MNPLLLPVVAAQGIRVRRTTEILPEAKGPTTGRTPGREPALRLSVIGESTAAGCGAATHEQAFTGALARALSGRTGRAVEWQVHGSNGATVRRVRHQLLSRLDGEVDLAVLLVGVNDVLRRRSVAEWSADLAVVLDGLAGSATTVAMTGIPPFADFPSLPRTLGRYLGERANALDDAARRLCGTRDRTFWIGAAHLLPSDPGFFARDGFHPSAQGYEQWAGAVAGELSTPTGKQLGQRLSGS
ncbi:SGNH/GDSL hydrolase family protein [Nakamurella sp. YIM 132087]|uniref:SGNH/GDSL hydrolase family protein n=1 Tax=Nakamurella alba TaxID=2665158 RepID=A0A7K1FTU2_9ACTN|nr:SGNH/GDSL hydrolase family protein [Nakamurella alba]MTD16593.1 SGNH/GDSL hydrolase family protein [Nakamurella alba]